MCQLNNIKMLANVESKFCERLIHLNQVFGDVIPIKERYYHNAEFQFTILELIRSTKVRFWRSESIVTSTLIDFFSPTATDYYEWKVGVVG